jgi:hypothetical protein
MLFRVKLIKADKFAQIFQEALEEVVEVQEEVADVVQVEEVILAVVVVIPEVVVVIPEVVVEDEVIPEVVEEDNVHREDMPKKKTLAHIILINQVMQKRIHQINHHIANLIQVVLRRRNGNGRFGKIY